jgi:excisionase family DNA binding protein
MAEESGRLTGVPGQLLFSIPNAARILDIGVSTTWKLIATGQLKTVKIGRSTRVTRESLVRLASGQS